MRNHPTSHRKRFTFDCLPPVAFLSLSLLSLSLSHTLTHPCTHTQAHTHTPSLSIFCVFHASSLFHLHSITFQKTNDKKQQEWTHYTRTRTHALTITISYTHSLFSDLHQHALTHHGTHSNTRGQEKKSKNSFLRFSCLFKKSAIFFHLWKFTQVAIRAARSPNPWPVKAAIGGAKRRSRSNSAPQESVTSVKFYRNGPMRAD